MIDRWSRMARPACAQCGNADIAWMPALELPWRCLPGDRRRAVEGLELFGGDADAWLCPACGDFGIFGPTELVVPPPANRQQRRRARRRP